MTRGALRSLVAKFHVTTRQGATVETIKIQLSRVMGQPPAARGAQRSSNRRSQIAVDARPAATVSASVQESVVDAVVAEFDSSSPAAIDAAPQPVQHSAVPSCSTNLMCSQCQQHLQHISEIVAQRDAALQQLDAAQQQLAALQQQFDAASRPSSPQPMPELSLPTPSASASPSSATDMVFVGLPLVHTASVAFAHAKITQFCADRLHLTVEAAAFAVKGVFHGAGGRTVVRACFQDTQVVADIKRAKRLLLAGSCPVSVDLSRSSVERSSRASERRSQRDSGEGRDAERRNSHAAASTSEPLALPPPEDMASHPDADIVLPTTFTPAVSTPLDIAEPVPPPSPPPPPPPPPPDHAR